MSHTTRPPAKQASDELGYTVPDLHEKLGLLEEALEAISDGFVLYDRDDKVLAYNSKFLGLFPFGASYRTLLRVQARRGLFNMAAASEEQWLQRRIAERANPRAPIEQLFEDGRVIRLSEHLTASGG
jgi:hypothetical protein